MNPNRRFLVVGEPFYRHGGEKHFDGRVEQGTVVTAPIDRRPDAEGDLLVNLPDAGWRVDHVSIEALVEIDEDGYPVRVGDFVLDGESGDDLTDADRELIEALAPIAFVLLRGAL